MSPSRPYEDRYCAYLDILGFQRLIDRLSEGATPFETLQALLEQIHNPPHSANGTFKNADFRAQSISDAVALSTSLSSEGLSQLFHSLEKLCQRLLIEGFFARGAVVKGKLYHDDRMVFGEALVRAYRLESEIVRFPRIMIARDVVTDAAPSGNRGGSLALTTMLKQADDGPWYLHILRTMEREGAYLANASRVPKPNAIDSDILRDFAKMAAAIQRRFDEAIDNPRHFEKVQWFARYWNTSIPLGLQGINHIKGPGLSVPSPDWVR
jgi:hypothetical protein